MLAFRSPLSRLATLLSVAAVSSTTVAAQTLEIHRTDSEPRALFFRTAANLATSSQTVFDKNLSRLTGVVIGVNYDPTSNKIVFGTVFKQNHLDQLVIDHDNGRAISQPPDDPFDPTPYFPGHWLYMVGTDASPFGAGASQISVTDSSVFDDDLDGSGVPDEMVVYIRDTAGNPIWSNYEFVRLVSIDSSTQITVSRGLYGTSGSFDNPPTGHTVYIAPFGGKPSTGRVSWWINFRTDGPRDPAQGNRRAWEAFADRMEAHHKAGGALAGWDGAQWDVSNYELPPKLLQRSWDSDNDGVADVDPGFVGSVNRYGKGAHKAYEASMLQPPFDGGGKFLNGDGQPDRDFRSFGVLDGIESEGYSDQKVNQVMNPHYHWSDYFNKLACFDAHKPMPNISYINHKFEEDGTWDTIPPSQIRHSFAMAPLLNMASTFFTNPPPDDPDTDIKVGIWDEFYKGREHLKGWLGSALDGTRHLALDEFDHLLGDGVTMEPSFASRWTVTPAGTVTSQPAPGPGPGARELAMDPGGTAGQEHVFELPDVKLMTMLPPVVDLCVYVTIRSEKLANMPATIGRQLEWRLGDVDALGDVSPESLCYGTSEGVQQIMFWRDVVPGADRDVDLQFVVPANEGLDEIYLSEMRLFATAPHLVREYSNGMVGANPSDRPEDLDLDSLFPGQRFRLLEGSWNQYHADPAFAALNVNNGFPLFTGEYTLGPRDGIFLVKEDYYFDWAPERGDATQFAGNFDLNDSPLAPPPPPASIPDKEEFALLEHVLRDPSAAWDGARASWDQNLAQLLADISPLVPSKDVSGPLVCTLAGYLTLGDPRSQTFAKTYLTSNLGVTIQLSNYNDDQEGVLDLLGDADGDGRDNANEWVNSGQTRPAYLAFVLDPTR